MQPCRGRDAYKKKLEYLRQRDAFVGDVDISAELGHLVPAGNQDLANSLLCFLLCGLAARFKIPVAYFFTKCCTGDQLANTIVHVIQKSKKLVFG